MAKRGCYAAGGKAKMRDLGGVKAPAYGTNPKVIDMAKGKTVGITGDGGIGPDGLPVKSRSDKPGRKMGGRSGKC